MILLSVLGLFAGFISDGVWGYDSLAAASSVIYIPIVSLMVPGLIFGILTGFYFTKKKNSDNLAWYIILSTIAYFVACCVVLMMRPAGLAGWGITSFIAGAVGALILSFGARLMLGKQFTIFWLLPIVGGALATLVLLGGFVMAKIPFTLNSVVMYFLFPIWQMGIAFTMSFFLDQSAEKVELSPAP